MQWELTNDRPLYIQLTEQLKRLILSGEYSPGEPFPSVRELATSANVNPNTMQRALSELEREGLLITERTADGVLPVTIRCWTRCVPNLPSHT